MQPKKDIPVQKLRIASLLLCPISPQDDADLDKPIFSDLQECQKKGIAEFKNEKPDVQARFFEANGLLRDSKGIVYIPSCDRLMILRLLVTAHCGPAGHRGVEATSQKILELFFLVFFEKGC